MKIIQVEAIQNTPYKLSKKSGKSGKSKKKGGFENTTLENLITQLNISVDYKENTYFSKDLQVMGGFEPKFMSDTFISPEDVNTYLSREQKKQVQKEELQQNEMKEKEKENAIEENEEQPHYDEFEPEPADLTMQNMSTSIHALPTL